MSAGAIVSASDLSWMIGSVVAAAVTAGPAYLAMRRSKGAAEAEGSATREALAGVRDELRSDIKEVRDWQAAHQTEHAIYSLDAHKVERRPRDAR